LAASATSGNGGSERRQRDGVVDDEREPASNRRSIKSTAPPDGDVGRRRLDCRRRRYRYYPAPALGAERTGCGQAPAPAPSGMLPSALYRIYRQYRT
jgi:hypothetical protein